LKSAKPLKHRAPVHFHSGTAEIEAEVRLFGGAAALQPGSTSYARMVLHNPALLLPGDRFIIRMFSPVVTIGGGVVVDLGERRYRKSDDVKARLDALSAADGATRVALLVKEARFGMGVTELVARTGMLEREIVAAAARAPLTVISQPQPWYTDRAWFQAARDRLVKNVREFHQKHPLQPGMARQDLRGRELQDAPGFVLDALIADAKEIVAEGETVRSRGHKLVLKEDEEQARAAIERAFQETGLAVPGLGEVLAKSGVEPARARSLLQILLREKKLVRISDELVFHQSAIEGLRGMLAGRRGTRFGVTAFKEWTGVSRKYAIPLLEFLDREKVTRRDGDERVVL
jgi:selenocysteine-specific elongation factor